MLPDHPPTGTLARLAGRDALAVLHRITTASLADLGPGRARTALFCDFRGRLLHRAAVAVTADGAVWLARDDAPAADLLAFVDRHVFREEVRGEDHGAGRRVRLEPGADRLEPGTLEERDGLPRRIQPSPGALLVVEDEPAPAGGAEAERARLRAGLPRHGREVREAFNPFEVGLAHEIHLAKGCFTGQEALLRLVTYGGVRRRLALVRGAGEPPAESAEVRSGAGRAGVVTSAAPEDGGWIGLAVLDRRTLDAAVALEVGGRPIDPPLPFPETRPAGLP